MEAIDQTIQPIQGSYWDNSWIAFKKNRFALAGLIIFFTLALLAIFVPLFSSHTYFETHLALHNQPPSAQYWFGTDELGRDLFVRIWTGARISLFVGMTAAFLDLCLGVFIGATAATFGGKVDECMMRVVDILYSLPYLLIVTLIIVAIGTGLTSMIIALTITGWVRMARITRAHILQLKQLDYVRAARCLGAGSMHILFRHFLPNSMGIIITTTTLTMISAIFSEAFLSFLGLGVQAPIASWGTMANEGLPALRYYPWRLFFPAIFICLTMLSLKLISDGLRDAFDPRVNE